jgi:hypothetical protein
MPPASGNARAGGAGYQRREELPTKSTKLSMTWLIIPDIGWNGVNLAGYQGCEESLLVVSIYGDVG